MRASGVPRRRGAALHRRPDGRRDADFSLGELEPPNRANPAGRPVSAAVSQARAVHAVACGNRTQRRDGQRTTGSDRRVGTGARRVAGSANRARRCQSARRARKAPRARSALPRGK